MQAFWSKISLLNYTSKPFCLKVFFFITFRAINNPDYFSLAIKTSENFPFPIDGPTSKSFKYHFFSISFIVKINKFDAVIQF